MEFREGAYSEDPNSSSVSEDSDITSGNGKSERREAIRQVLARFQVETVGEDGNPITIRFSDKEMDRMLVRTGGRLLEYSPDLIEGSFRTRFFENMTNLGICAEDWKTAVSEEPTLIWLYPEKIKANVEDSAARLGIDRQDFIQACLRHPDLFYKSPEKTDANVTGLAGKLGVSKQAVTRAGLRQPSIFASSPDTIYTHIEKSAEKLGLTKEEYSEAALRAPELFPRSPEAINANAEGSAKKLGISKEVFVRTALNAPSLLTYSPITIGGNFNVLEMIYGSRKRTWELIERVPPALTYSKRRNLMHYFAKLITGKERPISKNPETIIRNYFKSDPAKAERVIEAINELYADYVTREKQEATQARATEQNKRAHGVE